MRRRFTFINSRVAEIGRTANHLVKRDISRRREIQKRNTTFAEVTDSIGEQGTGRLLDVNAELSWASES
jgi:hypothetical protein